MGSSIEIRLTNLVRLLNEISDSEQTGHLNEGQICIIKSAYSQLCEIALVDQDQIGSNCLNDHMLMLLSIDELCRKVICDSNLNLDLWKAYLTLLKQHHGLINNDIANRACNILINYTMDGIESLFRMNVTSTNSENESNQIKNIMTVLFFFCQRISATLAYLLSKLNHQEIS
eukprot:gene11227-23475_t